MKIECSIQDFDRLGLTLSVLAIRHLNVCEPLIDYIVKSFFLLAVFLLTVRVLGAIASSHAMYFWKAKKPAYSVVTFFK